MVQIVPGFPPKPHLADARAVAPELEEELTDVAAVFALMDRREEGVLPRALAIESLENCGVLPREQVAGLLHEMAPDELDVRLFYDCTRHVIDAAAKEALQRSVTEPDPPEPTPTVGVALVGMLDYLRKEGLRAQDFRLAHNAKCLSDSIARREEVQRLQRIAGRQELEAQQIQELHAQQTREFHEAWTSNMEEFERQAVEVQEQLKARHQDELVAFQQQLTASPPKAYKFSRELLELKRQVQVLANQKRYDEADRRQRKAERLEMLERSKLDNDIEMQLAKRELALRRKHEQALKALLARIQRGREEHKDHWLVGAQRLIQSHRNAIADLRARQALESSRADVVIKLDLGRSRARASTARARNHYADAMPRIDTGRVSYTRAGRGEGRPRTPGMGPL